MSTQYFYGEPGGETKGPLPLESIQAAARSGRLGAAVMVSCDGVEPWASLDDVSRFGTAAFDGEKLEGIKSENRARNIAAMEKIDPRTVAGFLEVLGWINLFIGGAALIFMLAMAASGEPAFASGVSALGCLVTGVLFLAGGEMLRRLKEISAAVNSSR